MAPIIRNVSGLLSVIVLLLAYSRKFSYGSPHGDLAHPLGVDGASSEASEVTWPRPTCDSPSLNVPDTTWFVVFMPELACPRWPTSSDSFRYWHSYCWIDHPWEAGCHSWQHTASVGVRPGNCTVRIFKDDKCTELLDVPNAEYGPTSEPYDDEDKRRCVHIDDNPTDELKGSWNVTCPEVTWEIDDSLSEAADTLGSQDMVEMEDQDDIASPQIDTNNGESGTTESESGPMDSMDLAFSSFGDGILPYDCLNEGDKGHFAFTF